MPFLFLLLTPLFALGNEMPFHVGSDQRGFNTAFVSVTICERDRSNCKRVDRIKLDTGSSGLRIRREALRGLKFDSVETVQHEKVFECGTMAGGTGYWGPLVKADVQLGDELARGASFQIVDESSRPKQVRCLPFASDGRNGILGLGTDLASTNGNILYVNGLRIEAPNLHARNLITYLEHDNNGFSVVLPSLGAETVKSIDGKVIFGIGTQTNNQPHSINSVCKTRADKFLSLRHQNKTSLTMFDTGTFSYMVPQGQTAFSKCAPNQAYLCPRDRTPEVVEILNPDGRVCAKLPVEVHAYTINAETSKHRWVFSNLGTEGDGGASQLFLLGMPFFFGRQTFFGLEGQDSPLGRGPLVAFESNEAR